MDHVGGYINPLTLIRRLPKGLAVPRLRDRLRRIIGDFRTQTSLHEGCNGILGADCMHLMHRYWEMCGDKCGDFRTLTSLHEGCNGILSADCMHLMHRCGEMCGGWRERTRGRDEEGPITCEWGYRQGKAPSSPSAYDSPSPPSLCTPLPLHQALP